MKKVIVLILAVVLSFGISVSYAAKKKAIKKKAVVKQSQTKLGAIGTAQMPGEWCKFGQAYTIGKSYPMNLTVKSAEYSVGRIIVGTNTYFPEPQEKFLIVHFNVHNPVNYDQYFSSNFFKWTVVDSKNTNHEAEVYFGVEKSNEELALSLKPAQKIDGFAFFRVPVRGPVPKLIVEAATLDNSPVARYDLAGKISPLSAKYADPSDPSGSSAMEDTPGQIGQVYQANEYDFRIDKIEYVNAPPIAGVEPEEGKSYAVVSMWVKNMAASTHVYFPYSWEMKLQANDGSEGVWSMNAISISGNNEITPDLGPGNEIKARTYFTVPSGAAFSKLSVKYNNSRNYVIKF